MPKGVTDWHRQQRKKELQKNKAARIAARDERVKHEKTEASVQEEIRKIERQFKNPELRPHNIKSKLDRLQKELKLVQEDSAKKKENEEATNKRKFHQQRTNYQPLENPKLSVYYDAVMNPFGAPPPGKPRLYHRRGGGVTMNIDEAGMPSEPAQPPPPPPPPPPASQRRPSQGKICDKSRPRPTDAPPPRQPLPREQPASLGEESRAPKEADKPKKAMPAEMPALPPPSAAVQRSKRKLASDIWASTEEMEYEESSGIGALEGVAQQQQQRRTTGNNKQWWYQDMAGLVQGPFPTDQMKQWVQAGFFPITTFVRPSPQSSWKQLRNVEVFGSFVESDTTENNVASHPPDDQNAGLSTVQDRIAALREQHVPEKQSVDSDEDNGDFSVQDRIAALRQQHIQEQEFEQPKLNANDSTIEKCASEQQQQQQAMDSDEATPQSVQDRIAALRQQQVQVKHEYAETTMEDSGVYKEGGFSLNRGPSHPMEYPDLPSPPPPPTTAALVATISIPSYLIDEGPSYPTDDNAHVDDNIPYPVDMEYPIAEEYYSVDGSSLPVLGAYPIDEPDNSPIPTRTANATPPKKKVRVDKELTAFLPSHLQKKAMSKK